MHYWYIHWHSSCTDTLCFASSRLVIQNAWMAKGQIWWFVAPKLVGPAGSFPHNQFHVEELRLVLMAGHWAWITSKPCGMHLRTFYNLFCILFHQATKSAIKMLGLQELLEPGGRRRWCSEAVRFDAVIWGWIDCVMRGSFHLRWWQKLLRFNLIWAEKHGEFGEVKILISDMSYHTYNIRVYVYMYNITLYIHISRWNFWQLDV